MDLATFLFLAVSVPGQPLGAPPPQPPATEVSQEPQPLRAAHLSEKDADLLSFLRRRTHPPGQAELHAAIQELGNREAKRRDPAFAALVGWGQAAVPTLRQAINNPDELDASNNARDCLAAIDGSAGSSLTQAVVAALAARQTRGAAELLLAYLPRAEDDAVVEAIETALRGLAVEDDRLAPALQETLKDPVPLRRIIAVRVLCHTGTSAALDAVRPLLHDPVTTVRQECAVGLLRAHDPEGLSVLIDLVADLPASQGSEVEALLNELAGEWAIQTPHGRDATSRRLCRDLWAAWWRSTDGENLLAELRARTLTDEERSEVLRLVAALKAPAPEVREAAGNDLVRRFGKRAASLLRRLHEEGGEGVDQIDRVLQQIDRGTSQALPRATFRLLGLRRPKGTIEGLLAYAPFSESPAAEQDLEEVLATLGCPDGKPARPLLLGLRDPLAPRRAAAGAALCKGARKEDLAHVRKLLDDSDSSVRLQVAMALARRGDKEAVPVLIRLLGELPSEAAQQVEDSLQVLAGEHYPNIALAEDPARRGPALEAWQKWWREQEATVQMSLLAPTAERSGLLAIEQQPTPPNVQGRVLGLDARGKVLWEIGGLAWANDARQLPNGQVLVVEQQNRLTLRDRKGKVLWDRQYPMIFQVQPLQSGQLLLLCRNQVLVVDRDNKQVWVHHEPGFILGGGKLRKGHIAYFTNQGNYVRLDSEGKVQKTVHVPIPVHLGIGGLEVLPEDRLLVSIMNLNQVSEYNLAGKALWTAQVSMPGFPHRLPNGRTVVPLNNGNTSQLVELDRRGKVAVEKKDLPFKPFRIESP